MSNNFKEYDLNIFYAEDWSEEEGTTWDDVYTIQPSVYSYNEDTDAVTRQYMESFKISLEETRALAPDFPMEYWGNDFFLSLNTFYDMAKAIPGRVKQILSTLPPVDEVAFESDETKWLDKLFV